MNISQSGLILGFVLLAGCSNSLGPHGPLATEHSSPETVLVTYHVKPGSEQEFQHVLSAAWDAYRREHLVFARPHIVAVAKDQAGKSRFVELLTWVSHEAPEHVPDSVKHLWDQMQSLCEKRDGHEGVEGGEVELLVPTSSGSDG